MSVDDRPLRLLLFNLATDADDPLLGFATVWVNRLADFCEYVDVVTMRAGRLEVADNVTVYSAGKEKGYRESRRALEFYRILMRLLASRRYDACFAHMMPLFAGMGAPLLKLYGVPITLWFTHRQVTAKLRLALAVSSRVVTAAPSSFPIATDKLRPLGHGIDTDFFSPEISSPNSVIDPPAVVQVARLTPIKHQETLLRTLARGVNGQAIFVGGVPPERDAGYREKLNNLADELGITDRVTFTGDLPARAVRDWYRLASVAVNLTPSGSFDKAALESMACGVPTVVAHSAFDPLLGEQADQLRIDSPEDVAGLASRLDALLTQSLDRQKTLAAQLRARVVETHSLDGLVKRLISVLRTGEL